MREHWTGHEKIVAIAVAFRFGKKDHSWPSVQTVASAAGVSERTTRDCLHRLVQGDPRRGLLPMFTRSKRGRGFSYQFVGDPKALVEGRKRYTKELDAVGGSIFGATVGAGGQIDVSLNEESERHAEELRRRKAELDRQWILGDIDESTYNTERDSVVDEMKAFAKTVTTERRQRLPGKHVPNESS